MLDRMPDRNRKHPGGRPEFEVAYYTKELGKTLQRQLLTQQLAQLSEGNGNRNLRGKGVAPDAADPSPLDDGTG